MKVRDKISHLAEERSPWLDHVLNISCLNIALTFSFSHQSSTVIFLWERLILSQCISRESPFRASVRSCLTRKRRAVSRVFPYSRTAEAPHSLCISLHSNFQPPVKFKGRSRAILHYLTAFDRPYYFTRQQHLLFICKKHRRQNIRVKRILEHHSFLT